METMVPRLSEHAENADVESLLGEALALYGARVRDNLDLDRVGSVEAHARLVGVALMERGDARAFVLGRRLVAAVTP